MFKSKTTKILLTGLFFLFFFFICSSMVLAEDKPTELYLQTMIPGSEQRDLIKFDGTTRELGKYISSIYTYAISIVGIVATIMLMFGGFVWLTAGGSGDKVGKARDIIFGSLTGLVLTLTSYTLLNMINPDLVNFKVINIRQVDDKGGGLVPCIVDKFGEYSCKDGSSCDKTTLLCGGGSRPQIKGCCLVSRTSHLIYDDCNDKSDSMIFCDHMKKDAGFYTSFNINQKCDLVKANSGSVYAKSVDTWRCVDIYSSNYDYDPTTVGQPPNP